MDGLQKETIRISFVGNPYLWLEVDIEVRDVLLDQCVQLVHAQTQLSHAGLEHLPHPVVLHDLHQDCEGVLLWHLKSLKVLLAPKKNKT